jgi:TPR repeat protein
MKNKYLFIILPILININLVNANPIENPKICHNSIDESGCLLEIAKIKALKITDKNKQAEGFSRILRATAELNRSDFKLMEKSIETLKNKKLDLEHYLDLQIALATYFNKRNYKTSKLHIEKAENIFITAIKKNETDKKLILTTWACGLIDENTIIWKNVSHLTAEYCIPDYTKSLNANDEYDYQNIFISMFASWVQSDYIEFERNKKIIDKKINNLEEYAIVKNDKLISIESQKFKVINYSLQANLYRKSGLQEQAKQSLLQAREALIGLEKLTNRAASIESRLFLVSVYNQMHDYEEALDLLKPLLETIEDTTKNHKISLNNQVDYLVLLAHTLERGGFITYNEIKISNNDLRRRQADVLYEKFKILKYLDNKKQIYSKETLNALIAAAEAGNPFAMHNLGLHFAHGIGGSPKDLDKAAYWYSWSASLGFAGAQNNLGDLFEDSSTSDSDMGLSIYWYTQAAMQGEPTAYLSLGDLFFQGKGVPRNYVTACIWLSLAKKYLPDGTNKDKASLLLEKAAATLDEKAKKYIESRVFNFVPLKQTENKLKDKPIIDEIY